MYSMPGPYFSYDPKGDRFCFHATADKARQHAESGIRGYLNDRWAEEVTQVCWGRVVESAQECDRQEKPSGTELDAMNEDEREWIETLFGDYDYLVNYRLREIQETTPNV